MGLVGRLTGADLRFMAETVATERRDYDRIVEIIRDKEDFLEMMLEDEKLFRRVMSDEDILVRISPFLFFSILIRRTRRDLRAQPFTLEQRGTLEKIPVFDTEHIIELLEDTAVRDYLIDMLCSFTRVESVTFYFKLGRRILKRRFSDLDPDDMIVLGSLLDEEHRFPIYKRIGDIALFITGCFPEYVEARHRYPLSGKLRPAPPGKLRRSMEEWEEEGRRFYELAASHPSAPDELRKALERLSRSFFLARKSLNFMVERYLRFKKARIFRSPEGD